MFSVRQEESKALQEKASFRQKNKKKRNNSLKAIISLLAV